MFSLLSPGLFCFFLVPIAECFFAFLTDTLRFVARGGRLGRRVLVDLFGTPHFRLYTVACLRHERLAHEHQTDIVERTGAGVHARLI
jgi:hypothetical protein